MSTPARAAFMDFFDYATMHDLVRRAGLTSDSPATFYREMQAAAFVERARGVDGRLAYSNSVIGCPSSSKYCGRPLKSGTFCSGSMPIKR